MPLSLDPNQTSDDSQAPDFTMGQDAVQPAPNVTNPSPAMPTLAPQGGSRLAAILSAVSHVATTALASIPDKGRPSFVTGLGQGARGAQAEAANQQAIKFKTFDDQVRAAQLHNQDIALQNQ